MAQFIGFWCQVSGFGCQGTEVLNPDTLYETTRGGTANRSLRRAQAEWNIEQEISNDEAGNRCVQSFLKIKMVVYLTSIFIIPCSIFVIRFFKVSFSIKLAAFQTGGTARMKLHLIRQDLRD